MTDGPKYLDRRAGLFRRHYEAGLDYAAYVASGEEKHRARWHEMIDRVSLTGEQAERIGALNRPLKLLVVSGTWCGDCVRQVPILRRIEQVSTVTAMRLVDRDADPELRDELRINGAAKVPVAVFLTEEYFELSRYGDRSLSTYRAMARNQLGPACPIGPAPLGEDELAGAIAEWVNEFERVQLIMRLSPHLREKYGD